MTGFGGVVEHLQKFDLDERGVAYVRQHLSDVNILSYALLEVVEREPGRVWTLAPAGVTPDRLHDFERGGLLAANLDFSRAVAVPEGRIMMAVESLHLERAERILNQLRATPGSVCIIDDFNPTWGDGVYEPEPSAFGVGTEVYHLITGQETVDEVADVLSWGDTIWHGAAALCRPVGQVTRASLSDVEALVACARTAVEICCTAYDREGFVVWTHVGDGVSEN
jgi:hypothetical protein